MIRKTRTVVVATLALAALTGCGGAAAEARGVHTYDPLPPLSTATPTTSPAPQPTSPPAPTSSPSPSAPPATTPAVDGAADSAGAGAPAAAPVQAPVTAVADAAAPVAAPVAAPIAAPVAAAPIEVTETVSTTTSSVTSTTLEARIMIVVTCEGWCDLGDLAAPGLTGADGPISPASIRDLLETEAERQGGDEQELTEELIESLAKEDWDLLEQQFKNGQEKFVFTSAADQQ